MNDWPSPEAKQDATNWIRQHIRHTHSQANHTNFYQLLQRLAACGALTEEGVNPGLTPEQAGHARAHLQMAAELIHNNPHTANNPPPPE